MTLVGWKGLKGKAVSEVYVFHSVRFNTNEFWNETPYELWVFSVKVCGILSTTGYKKRVYTKFYNANTVESD